MSVTIAPAVAEQLGEIAAIECAALPAEAWGKQQLANALCDQQQLFLVACAGDGTVVGHILCRVVCGDGELLSLAVSPAARCRGVGRALLQAAQKEALRRGCTAMGLEVRAQNRAAIALYRDQGFIPVGRRRGFYRAPIDDALVMLWQPPRPTQDRSERPAVGGEIEI